MVNFPFKPMDSYQFETILIKTPLISHKFINYPFSSSKTYVYKQFSIL